MAWANRCRSCLEVIATPSISIDGRFSVTVFTSPDDARISFREGSRPLRRERASSRAKGLREVTLESVPVLLTSGTTYTVTLTLGVHAEARESAPGCTGRRYWRSPRVARKIRPGSRIASTCRTRAIRATRAGPAAWMGPAANPAPRAGRAAGAPDRHRHVPLRVRTARPFAFKVRGSRERFREGVSLTIGTRTEPCSTRNRSLKSCPDRIRDRLSLPASAVEGRGHRHYPRGHSRRGRILADLGARAESPGSEGTKAIAAIAHAPGTIVVVETGPPRLVEFDGEDVQAREVSAPNLRLDTPRLYRDEDGLAGFALSTATSPEIMALDASLDFASIADGRRDHRETRWPAGAERGERLVSATA